MLKTVFVRILCIAVFSGMIDNSFAREPKPLTRRIKSFSRNTVTQANDYEADVNRLFALRSHSLDELLALSYQLEIKWRQIDWNQYAQIMMHICSEISNRGINDSRLRQESEHFATVALSHSKMFSWEYESSLLGWLGYRSSSSDSAWLRERREKAERWLQTWRRLEKEFDPSFDINDRKNGPSLRVYPPIETGLPAGTPPSAIKDSKLRAQYEAAIAENKKRSKRVDQQLPLVLHGPSFKTRAEHWLIGAYSQPPLRNAELKRLLEMYVRDATARQRILSEIGKNIRAFRESDVRSLRLGFSRASKSTTQFETNSPTYCPRRLFRLTSSGRLL